MKFTSFSKVLEKLEKTASRNEMTVILAELLNSLGDDEVLEGVSLSLGRLKPLYDSLEFNLAEKQLGKSLSRAYSVPVEQIIKDYRELGDFGILAQKLAKNRSDSSLTIVNVYRDLERIARLEGEGSQEEKIAGLADLLTKVDALSAKYICRMVLGKLRLGFSDKTILDALSTLKRGDKSAKKGLEQAYQIRPDIGQLVLDVKKKGIEKAFAEIEIKLGIPMMPMLCQRLKSPREMIKKMGEVAVEAKFDGTRVQIHFKRTGDWQVKTFTRNLEETSHMFPELARSISQLEVSEAVFDSEAVGIDPKTGRIMSFQATITRKRKHGISEAAKQVPLRFYLFDCLYLDGKSLIDKPYYERREILKEAVKPGNLLVVDDFVITKEPEVITKMHLQLVSEGLEGVIVKKLDSRYIPGRTGWSWVKMKEAEESAAKLSDTIDCVVMGYYSGKGKRTQFGLGAFLVGVRKGDLYLTIAKIGTGLTDEQFRELKKRLDVLVTTKTPKEYLIPKNLMPEVIVSPKLVVEIAADEITKSPIHTAGVALRFPRLVKFRDDKSPSEATTITELKKL